MKLYTILNEYTEQPEPSTAMLYSFDMHNLTTGALKLQKPEQLDSNSMKNHVDENMEHYGIEPEDSATTRVNGSDVWYGVSVDSSGETKEQYDGDGVHDHSTSEELQGNAYGVIISMKPLDKADITHLMNKLEKMIEEKVSDIMQGLADDYEEQLENKHMKHWGKM